MKSSVFEAVKERRVRYRIKHFLDVIEDCKYFLPVLKVLKPMEQSCDEGCTSKSTR